MAGRLRRSGQRRTRAGRDRRTIASSTAAARLSDIEYLINLRRRTRAPRVDITGADKRFYHPDRIAKWPLVREPYKYRRLIVLPERFRQYATYRGTRKLSDIQLSWKLGFHDGPRILVCVRRRRRREVLHALRRVPLRGGAKGRYRPRRNLDSEIRC